MRVLHQLFRMIWIYVQIPLNCMDDNIKHLYKNKMIRRCCDNSREISFLCIAGNIWARLILNSIVRNMIDEIYPQSQCGFRSGAGKWDMVSSLHQVAQKARVKNSDLFIVFVDLIKTFDTANRQALWNVLKKLRIPNEMLNIMLSFLIMIMKPVHYPSCL